MQAFVISSSRRFVTLYQEDGSSIQAKTSAKTLEIAVGDRVEYEARDGDNFITKILDRNNQLTRGYRGELKIMAANLDCILIVTAVGSSFNPLFVDKVLTFAFCHDIPAVLVINKIDQGLEQTSSQLKLYQDLGFKVFCISAKFGNEVEQVEGFLADKNLKVVALVGISGVGKSTLLNRLVPDARTRTQETNERTGLGRQTTTQALAHPYYRADNSLMFLVDLPGLQSFGVGHLNQELIAESFPEINRIQSQCEFSNCSHIKEKVCAVQLAVNEGLIEASRYQSYQKMIEEIAAERKY
jgi:ribosome biogenesis GTPase